MEARRKTPSDTGRFAAQRYDGAKGNRRLKQTVQDNRHDGREDQQREAGQQRRRNGYPVYARQYRLYPNPQKERRRHDINRGEKKKNGKVPAENAQCARDHAAEVELHRRDRNIRCCHKTPASQTDASRAGHDFYTTMRSNMNRRFPSPCAAFKRRTYLAARDTVVAAKRGGAMQRGRRRNIPPAAHPA